MLIFGSTLGSSKWDESYNYKHDQGQNFEMFQSISLLFLIKRQIFLLAVLLQPVSCVSQFCVGSITIFLLKPHFSLVYLVKSPILLVKAAVSQACI